MRKLAFFLAILVLCGSALGQITSASLQAQIDKLPMCNVAAAWSAGGGTVNLPPGEITLTTTVFVPSAVHVKGNGPEATRIHYTGPRGTPAFAFSCLAGHGQHQIGEVSDLSIYADNGDGIGIDPKTAFGEVFGPQVHNLVFNVGGTAINFRPPTGKRVYFADIANIHVPFARQAIDVNGVGTHLDRVEFSNPRRALADSKPEAFVVIDDQADIHRCRFEGDWGCPLLLHRGGLLNVAATYFEPHWPKATVRPQVILDGDSAVWDAPMFVQPHQPVLLRHRAVLHVGGSLNVTDDDGGVPSDPRAYADLVARSYLGADICTVIFDGKRLSSTQPVNPQN